MRGGGDVPGSSVALPVKLGIYLLFLSVYLMSSAGHLFTSDHVAVYRTTESLVERQSLAIRPMLETVKGPDGQAYARYGVGQPIASIPLYLVGTTVERLAPQPIKEYSRGPRLGALGGSVPVFFVSLFNQLVTPLTCLLVFLFGVGLGFSSRTVFVTTLVFGFGTAVWVYARDYFQHPLESLLLLLSVYVLFSRRHDLRPRHALFSGIAFAGGIITRPNLLLVAPAVFIYLLWLSSNSRPRELPGSSPQDHGQTRRVVWNGLLFGLPIALVVGGILYLNQVRFGYLLEFGYLRLGGFESSVSESVEKGFSNPLLLGLYGNLFSLGRSVFLYSPPTILLLFAFREFYRRQRAEALLFVSIIAIYFLAYSSFGDWHGGWAWGPRYLLPMLPFMIIPVGYFLEGGAKLAIAAAITAAGVFVQVLGLGVSYGNVYWDWVKMGLYPDSAFLFVPEISPIPTHFNNLIDGRYVDLWLVWVYRTFGAEVLAWTASVLLFVLGISVFLLRGMGPRLRSGVRSRRGHELPGRGPVILSGAKNLEAFAIRRFRSFANAQDDRGRKQSGRKRSG